MSIERVEMREIPSHYRLAKIQKDVMAFYDSGWDAAKVNAEGYKNAASAYSAYKTTIKRLRVNCTVMVRGNSLYLLREEQ